MKRVVSILLGILFVTAAYVFAWPSASVPYFAGVILHVVAGAVLLVALIFTLRKLLRSSSPASKIGWLLIALGGVLGIALLFTGTRRTEWTLLYAHIAACVAGGALLAASWAARRGFLARGGTDLSTGGTRLPPTSSGVATLARCAIFLIAAAALSAGAWWLRTVPWQRCPSHRKSRHRASLDG